MKVLKVNNISKKFNSEYALKNISFEVEKGEIFGIIGPDGAGKTTLFRILTTLILSDSGNAMIIENDIIKDYKEIRKILGYMPGSFSLYHDLSVEENLEFFASVFNVSIEDNYYLIKDIYSHLLPFKKRRAGNLSGGMKQKLALSCALIHKPEILFLDEPTTGVDPVSRKEFWHMLKRLQNQGITIIVSTPYMDEAKLCDRIALINKGEFIDIDSPEAIISKFPKKLFRVERDNMPILLKQLREDANIETCYSFGDSCHITLNNEDEENNYKEIKPTIEDYFMRLSE
ncbi:MAG: ABC transporter ATP-binding protein [Bacteroidales bacterium]